ncbi:hypothetical protein [Shimia sp.]|uniref:hypothetical protein n=1 Tax=Shimia sp. TaxID=1954381 RepID=UPI00329873B0
MVKRMHAALLKALRLSERPDGWKHLAATPSRGPDGVRAGRTWSDPHSGSLVSLLNRQIADAQARLKGLSDPVERQSQTRLISELRKHLHLELKPQHVCA